jgi:25S rRNA (uracil2634-N3)-methyltransferase
MGKKKRGAKKAAPSGPSKGKKINVKPAKVAQKPKQKQNPIVVPVDTKGKQHDATAVKDVTPSKEPKQKQAPTSIQAEQQDAKSVITVEEQKKEKWQKARTEAMKKEQEIAKPAIAPGSQIKRKLEAPSGSTTDEKLAAALVAHKKRKLDAPVDGEKDAKPIETQAAHGIRDSDAPLKPTIDAEVAVADDASSKRKRKADAVLGPNPQVPSKPKSASTAVLQKKRNSDATPEPSNDASASLTAVTNKQRNAKATPGPPPQEQNNAKSAKKRKLNMPPTPVSTSPAKAKLAKVPLNPPKHAPIIPFEQDERILLVGEGDFSFAASVVEHHGCYRIVATCLDTQDQLFQKYDPQAKDHVRFLEEECQTVLYNVDATKLAKTKAVTSKEPQYDVVVFNFPHVGGKSKDVNRQVRFNQEMLVGFFKAAIPILADEGRIVVTLFEGEPYTLWNIRDLARHSGLEVQRSFKFAADAYPGYSHARTLGNIDGGGGWKGEDREARSYVFHKKGGGGREHMGQQKPNVKKKRKRAHGRDSDDDG